MKVHAVLMMVFLLLASFQLQAANSPPEPPVEFIMSSPGAELWREVRQRDGEGIGTSQVKSPRAEVLVKVSGQDWCNYRMQEVSPKAGAA